jgi:Calpain family cysteine protease
MRFILKGMSQDILDPDYFWKEELLHVNKDRVFGCSFDSLRPTEDNPWDAPEVEGLIGGHAYSILRAVDCKGKRFVVLRNPWGKGEWTGRWSDGSQEWTREWLDALPELDHGFGNDGQFVMECKHPRFLRRLSPITHLTLPLA